MRALSILAVMSLHFGFGAYVNKTSVAPDAIALRFCDAFARNGDYGVLLFFVISGFVIARITHIRYGGLFAINVPDFYARRIARIWPLLITVVAVALYFVSQVNATGQAPTSAVDQILTPNPKNFDSLFYLSLCTFTNNILVFGLRPGQYGLQWLILWSIAVEEQFYLFFPVCLKSLRNRKRLLIFLYSFIAIGPLARFIVASFGSRAALISSFGFYDLVAMGILLFVTFDTYGERIKRSTGLAASMLFSGAVLAALVYYFRQPDNVWHDTLAPSFFGAGAFFLLLGGLSLKITDNLPLVLTFPGQLSYGMYLYHPLVMLAVVALTQNLQLHRLQLFAVYVASNTAFSAISFFMFEKPLNLVIYQALRKLSKRWSFSKMYTDT